MTVSREDQLRIQALGAALSRRDWHATEIAYAAIRDEFDRRYSQAGQEDVRQEELAQLRYEAGMYQALYENLKAQSPPTNADIQRCLDTIEGAYDFQCEAGPLKNCGEWKYLKRFLSAFPRDAQQGETE